MSLLQYEDHPHGRASAEVKDLIAVREALSGIVRGMSHLQHEAAFLRGMVARSPHHLGNLERIISLGQDVRKAIEEFDDVVLSLPPSQREHSRVTDMQHALDALASGVPRLPQ